MKIRLLLITLLFLTHSFAGGFRFPNQPYSTAKLFLFNTHHKSGRPDLYIYRNGIYAKSKIGNGENLNREFIGKLNHIFRHGIEEIWMGLSKCSIPRHGIIFYNKHGLPIASISICFQCQQVNFWSSVKIHSNPDYENMDLDKAKRQIKEIKYLFKKNNIPVYENVENYKVYVDLNPNYKVIETYEIENTSLDNILGKKYTIKNIKQWILGGLTLKKDTNEERTMSRSYLFAEYYSNTKNDYSKFTMSGLDDDSYLIDAKIYSNQIKLPKGFQVGMSHQDILNKLTPVFQGVKTYNKIVVSGKKYKLELDIKNQTLQKITYSIWPN